MENLIRGELKQWGGKEMRKCLKQKHFIDGLDASRRVSNSIHCKSGLYHTKSEAVPCASHFSDLLSPKYLYMSASQSVATISHLNSLPLNLGQPPWAGIDMKEDCMTLDWTLSYLLTERPERKVCRRKFPSHLVWMMSLIMIWTRCHGCSMITVTDVDRGGYG